MLLFEVFDTKFDITWHSFAWGEQGGFAVNGVPFIVQLEKQQKISNLTVAEVTFYRADLEQTKYDIQKDSVAPFSIYGVVLNAIVSKQHEYDGFYFRSIRSHVDEQGHEQRTRIYWNLAHELERRSKMVLYTREHQNESEWLLLKHPERLEGGWQTERDRRNEIRFPEIKQK